MLKIYVASHIDIPLPSVPYCSRVQAGAANQISWNGLRDDTGQNISSKNGCYAESTVLYWIWKNTTDEKVGLCHYRRYFSPILFENSFPLGVTAPLHAVQSVLDVDREGHIFDLELTLAQIIVPIQARERLPIAQAYEAAHRASDWQTMCKVLLDVHREEGREAEAFFNRTNAMHYWCMFIMHRQLLNEYCEWLFAILFQFETQIEPPDDPKQARIIGFLSERLLNWWVVSRGLKVVHRPILTVVPNT